MWRDPPTSKEQTENSPLMYQDPNPRAPFFSSIWRTFTTTPLAKRSEQTLEKRKDTTTTVFSTVTEALTIHINQTVYTTLTTEVFYTHNITIFQPTTITQNQTMTTTTPRTVSVPVTTTVSMTAPSTYTTTPTNPTSLHLQPSAAANSQSSVVTSEQHHGLSTKGILAIVFGVLGFLVLLLAVLWGIRWFLQKYRHERVERKRLQTEANELPVMRTGDEEGGAGKERGKSIFAIE